MTHVDPGVAWAEWSEENEDRDDATQLAALHEVILRDAVYWTGTGEITADWANKKLATLGITGRIGDNRYTLEMPISGTMTYSVAAANRADAEAKLNSMLSSMPTIAITAPVSQGSPVFTSGPEDVDPNTPNPDAPTTVQATLEKLREIILLGNIAGPRFNCDSGASRVLASYGLAPVPERKEFVVTRPVQGAMRTIVEAYDEASAERVAGWRWENGRRDHEVTTAVAYGNVSVEVN